MPWASCIFLPQADGELVIELMNTARDIWQVACVVERLHTFIHTAHVRPRHYEACTRAER